MGSTCCHIIGRRQYDKIRCPGNIFENITDVFGNILRTNIPEKKFCWDLCLEFSLNLLFAGIAENYRNQSSGFNYKPLEKFCRVKYEHNVREKAA